MVDFSFAGGDGASTGDGPQGDDQPENLRDIVLRFQEDVALILEECRESQANLTAGQKKWVFKLPDEIRDDPQFATVVKFYDIQSEVLANSLSCSVASTRILETWLVSVRELLKLIDPHIP